MDALTTIPEELQIYILLYLNNGELIPLFSLCKYMNKLIEKDDFWLPQLQQNFPQFSSPSRFFLKKPAKVIYQQCLGIKTERNKILRKISTLEYQTENGHYGNQQIIPARTNTICALGMVDPSLIVTSYREIFHFFKSCQQKQTLKKLKISLKQCDVDNVIRSSNLLEKR